MYIQKSEQKNINFVIILLNNISYVSLSLKPNLRSIFNKNLFNKK